ncbi:MAG TPA: hypothetical protein VID77_00990 [Stellaceae bacterium]|jgi:hypothetical protein
MKWMGVAIMSAIMGVFLAVLAQTAFPWLTQSGFMAAAVVASVMIFAIMMRLALTAGTIEVLPPNEWDIHHKLRNT